MIPSVPTGSGAPRQLRPTEVKRLNREWRRASDTRLALLLDSVAQPFNVGSIVRSAAAFGVEQLWLCGNTAPLGHPGVAKTALGTQRLVEVTQEPNPVAAAKAAAAAGLRVIAVPHPRYPPEPAALHAASLVLTSLADLTVEAVADLPAS